METIQEYQGKLVIVDDWQPSWAEPVDLRHYWPTGVDAKLYAHLVGQTVGSYSNGYYVIRPDQHNAGVIIELEDDGNSKPVFVEERPIKKPRGMKVYSNGRWMK